jgi:hypothetical protein
VDFRNKPNHAQLSAVFMTPVTLSHGDVLPMKSRAKRILLLATGWTFVLLGVVGLVLPFLQGVLFILVGLIILSSQYVWARLLLSKLRKRFPKISRVADGGAAKATTFLKRFSRQHE